MTDRSDRELLREFGRDGDESSFTELVNRHGDAVLGAATAVLGNSDDARDVVQSAFLALVEHWARLDDRPCVGGWLHRVAVNLARNMLRGRIRRSAREKEAGASVIDATTITSDQHDLDVLQNELAGLKDLHRVPLVLHYLEGRSYKESAALCGCNEKTFSTRLLRARKKLRKRLIKRGITGVTMASLTAMLVQTAEAAEVSAGFVAATCEAASGGAVSAKVGALTESALKMLFWGKVKTVAAAVAAERDRRGQTERMAGAWAARARSMIYLARRLHTLPAATADPALRRALPVPPTPAMAAEAAAARTAPATLPVPAGRRAGPNLKVVSWGL